MGVLELAAAAHQLSSVPVASAGSAAARYAAGILASAAAHGYVSYRSPAQQAADARRSFGSSGQSRNASFASPGRGSGSRPSFAARRRRAFRRRLARRVIRRGPLAGRCCCCCLPVAQCRRLPFRSAPVRRRFVRRRLPRPSASARVDLNFPAVTRSSYGPYRRLLRIPTGFRYA